MPSEQAAKYREQMGKPDLVFITKDNAERAAQHVAMMNAEAGIEPAKP